MSTKISITYHGESKTHLYEEMTLDDDFQSDAYIQIERPTEFSVSRHENGYETAMLAIKPEAMDALAIAWCKHRKLQGALGGPVGKEWGGPDCDYD
ncbi:hypothetical protein [Alkalimarinus alittae]|uniref:Uncharacterized protein n=1 Tax=Alkalimarinus alittae TaxID=2961619 RepID=A0ABY6MX42_9ALTE|nr:hypothetical protein [Alkalimarinus alittae]UZE94380.1 hypothetical protein NKI27_09755 [Alkalimarinus alittae]